MRFDKFVLWFGRIVFPFLTLLNFQICCRNFNGEEYWNALFSAAVASFMIVMAIVYWKNDSVD